MRQYFKATPGIALINVGTGLDHSWNNNTWAAVGAAARHRNFIPFVWHEHYRKLRVNPCSCPQRFHFNKGNLSKQGHLRFPEILHTNEHARYVPNRIIRLLSFMSLPKHRVELLHLCQIYIFWVFLLVS